MSRKGRRSRSNRPKKNSARTIRASSAPPANDAPVSANEATGATPSERASVPASDSAFGERPGETESPSVAPAGEAVHFPGATGELQAKFFEELSSDAWLAHELELRDPRFLQKMTESVARRRAHFARYVVGVVAVSAALCVAALVKAAVPGSADRGEGVDRGGRTSVPVAAPGRDAPGAAFGASVETGTDRGP